MSKSDTQSALTADLPGLIAAVDQTKADAEQSSVVWPVIRPTKVDKSALVYDGRNQTSPEFWELPYSGTRDVRLVVIEALYILTGLSTLYGISDALLIAYMSTFGNLKY